MLPFFPALVVPAFSPEYHLAATRFSFWAVAFELVASELFAFDSLPHAVVFESPAEEHSLDKRQEDPLALLSAFYSRFHEMKFPLALAWVSAYS